jgi:1-acyl-sn-glycerol-3-phosphate acyltransferase
MLIGSPARAMLRIVVYAAVTLPLIPLQLIGVLLLPPLGRWLPIPYHRTVCWILGLKLKVNGRKARKRPTLFVVNHVSYLDIEVLGALIPGSFVAKKEVATWPFFSILAKLQRSVFVDRRMTATKEGQDEMFRRLSSRDNLILFPEGTSGDGTRVLPFRSALFAVAQLKTRDGKPITVQPVSLAYTRLDGIPLGRHWRPFYTWFGDMEMAPHLWQMAGLGEVEVVVNFHDPVSLADFPDRKALADYCHKVVYAGVAATNSGRFELLPVPRKAA